MQDRVDNIKNVADQNIRQWHSAKDQNTNENIVSSNYHLQQIKLKKKKIVNMLNVVEQLLQLLPN